MATKAIDSLYVEIFDWPDRYLVECENPDSDYPRAFKGLQDFDPMAPYLVDLSECYEGWCGCRDFAVNILPQLHTPTGRKACKHIMAARLYLHRINYKRPKKLPPLNL